MKKLLKILTIFLLLSQTDCFAQDEEPFWEYITNPYGGIVSDLNCDSTGNCYASGQNGIFHSDLIGPWKQICRGIVQKTAIGKNDFIFANMAVLRVSSADRIIRSTDYGESWDTLTGQYFWMTPEQMEKKDRARFYDIRFDLNDRLYITMVFDDDYSKIMYSDDYGETWQICKKEFEHPLKIRLSGVYRNGILAANIYDGTADWGTRNKYSLSYDNGETWIQVDLPNSRNYVLYDVDFLSESDIVFNVNNFYTFITSDSGKTIREINAPYNLLDLYCISPEEMYAGTIAGIIYTSDGGYNWEIISEEEVGLSEILYDTKGNFIGRNYWEVVKSSDNGRTFTHLKEGYINNYIEEIIFDKNGDVYFGYDGIYKSTDDGMSWSNTNINDMMIRYMFSLEDGTLIAGCQNCQGEVFKSTNNGDTWERYPEFTPFRDIVQTKNGYLFTRHGFCSKNSRSTDNGNTWEVLPDSYGGGEAIAVNNEDHIFSACGFFNNGINRSTDYGETWEQVYSPQINITPFENIFLDPDSQIGFALNGNYETNNNGKNWFESKARDNGLGLMSNRAIVLDSIGNFWIGYYRSTDKGKTWEDYSSGIPKEHWRILAMAVSPKGYIYLASTYAGIYRSREAFPPTSVETKDTESHPLTIFPNPSSETAEISYYLSRPSGVKLKLFNSLGIEMTAAVEEYKDTGVHSQTIDVSGLSPGMYFFQLETEYGVETEKIAVVK